MITSPAGLALVKHFEGEKLTAYRDAVGIWTIGVGHNGRDVRPGQTITADESTALLMRDLSHAEVSVAAAVTKKLEQHQFDALVSLVFNIGEGSFKKSTLLLRVNACRFDEAADQFLRWDKAQGRQLPGLVKRRAAERLMFLGLDWQ